MNRAVAEVASLFSAPIPAPAPNVPEEVYPGYPGLVFAGDELCTIRRRSFDSMLGEAQSRRGPGDGLIFGRRGR